MDVTVTDVPELRRYEARVDGALAAFADDIPTGELLAIAHTRCCPPSRAGASAVPWCTTPSTTCVRGRGSVFAVCPFVSGWIARHAEQYGDLLYQLRTGVVRD